MYTLHTCTCINKQRVTRIHVQRHNTDYHALYTIKNKEKYEITSSTNNTPGTSSATPWSMYLFTTYNTDELTNYQSNTTIILR